MPDGDYKLGEDYAAFFVTATMICKCFRGRLAARENSSPLFLSV